MRLLGGLVTMSGVTSTVVSSSDGTTGQSKGRADYGTLTIAGQTFGFGPEGYIAAGTPGAIPGLPDNPTAALAALGITVHLPKPTYKADGDKASGTIEGLIVTIDLKTLKPVLSQLPLGQILAQIPFPPEAALLKSLLSSIGNLSPKIVLHLGYATSTVDTVQSIPSPGHRARQRPDQDPTESEGGTTGGATGGGTDLGGDASALPPVDGSATATDGAPELTNTSATSGLPPLFSIPGLLLLRRPRRRAAGRQLLPPARVPWPSAPVAPARTASSPAFPTCERFSDDLHLHGDSRQRLPDGHRPPPCPRRAAAPAAPRR